MIDIGSARLGMIVADQLRREEENPPPRRGTASTPERERTAASTDALIVSERSYRMFNATDGGGISCRIFSSGRLHAVGHVHRVRTRLALNDEHDGARAVVPARGLVVLDVVGDSPDLFEMDWRAVAVRHDHVAKLTGVLELASSPRTV